MSKILYILPLVTLAWTAISFAGLPLWMIAKRRDRAFNRLTNWSDDYLSFDSSSHPPIGTAAPANSSGFDGSAADNLQVIQ